MSKVIQQNVLSGPWNNLPTFCSKKSPELRFANAFVNSWKKRIQNKTNKSVIIREFSLQGHGIADCICVEKGCNQDSHNITVFEFKISDWKKGVGQAYKYSYFANKSYLVVPDSLVCTILNKTNCFNDLKIGLLGFESKTKSIMEYVPPKTTKPTNLKSRRFALKKLASTYRNLRFLGKNIDGPQTSL